MAKIQCYNCRKVTPVVAPKYRCKFCNYPLNQYIESEQNGQNIEETIIDNPELEQDRSLLDVLQNQKQQEDKLEGIAAMLEKIQQPDPETIEKVEQKLDKIEQKVEQIPVTPISDKVSELADILSAHAKQPPVVVKKNHNPDKKGKVIAGWLVIHTENRSTITYELFEGDNLIGRHDGPENVDIRIEDDEYVSRVHAVIQVSKDFLHRFRYTLYDNGKQSRNHKPSTNGTFINGYSDRLPQDGSIFLHDGDTIQIGLTKLVFKNTDEADSYHSATISVRSSDFTNTIAIRNK